MNGNPQLGGLEGVLAELDRLVAFKQAEVDQVSEELNVLQTDLRRMRAMQRAAKPAVQSTRQDPRKGKAQSPRYGEEELAIVLDKLRDLNPMVVPEIPGSFTTRTLREELGIGKSTCDRMINYLRETERIRLVGERPFPGSPRPMRVFVVNNDE